MATKAATSVYAPGEDPESMKANLEYQEALRKLTESIDQRKNRFFDPTWLAAAQGFLAPGAPDFFESLGRVAGNVGKAQEAQVKENQDIAQMRLDLAGRGVELQRQKARDAMVRRLLAGEGEPPAAEPQAGALPGTPGRARGALAQTQGAAPSQEMGLQIAPPVPGISRQQFFALGLLDNKSPSDLAKEWETIVRGRQQVKDNFLVNVGTGIAYALPTGQLEEVQIFSEDGTAKTYRVARDIAAELSAYAKTGDAEKYFALAKRITQAPQRQTAQGAAAQLPPVVAPAAVQAPLTAPTVPALAAVAPAAVASSVAPGSSPASPAPLPPVGAAQTAAPARIADQAAAAPQLAAQAAPAAVPPVTQAALSGLRSQEQIAEEKRRSEIDQAAETERRKKLAQEAAVREAAVEQTDRTARSTYQSASKILDYVKKSPNFFGIFARPGVVPAIGGFIEQGLRTPTGTIDLPGFRESITKLMPNVRQQDLDNVVLAAAELAEIELNFSRQYFQGQGAVTENERKIVRAIPGSVSSSPRVLKARMELLRDRAQYDIDVADAFRDWQKNNMGRSYLDFERESQLYKDVKKDFDNKAAKIYNGLPAIPTRERTAAQNRAAGAPGNIDTASDTLENILKKGRP